jgi:hypothetical protein
LDARSRDRDAQARFHLALLCRDAPPFPGLTDGQARSHAQRNVHFNARLSAVTLAKLDARHGEATAAFSLARLTRRAVTQQLIERMVQPCAAGHSVEHASPDDEARGHSGLITETAA